MKIYKAIGTDELERYTSDGWTWDGVERREQRVTEHRDIDGRYMTAEEQKLHGLHNISSYNIPKIYNHKQFFGDVIIFLVWKEQETINRENVAETRANTAEFELKKLNEAVEKHNKAIEDLNKRLEESAAIARQRQEQIWSRDERNRKLEADISKIRTAIGTDRMNEILDVKKPS